ncbi:hypothetical protein Ddye_001145 [Dipteronia dyeriana]|uniref:Uncharacterized protein n=1 Tax=Dipteronia dyeriana TaxID=168575 RepID=A0AAD9XNJ3_9ROSI|nr:hypothetical protein Ddye_001145 [Dipteronia dyeriana]
MVSKPNYQECLRSSPPTLNLLFVCVWDFGFEPGQSIGLACDGVNGSEDIVCCQVGWLIEDVQEVECQKTLTPIWSWDWRCDANIVCLCTNSTCGIEHRSGVKADYDSWAVSEAPTCIRSHICLQIVERFCVCSMKRTLLVEFYQVRFGGDLGLGGYGFNLVMVFDLYWRWMVMCLWVDDENDDGDGRYVVMVVGLSGRLR